MPHLTLYKMFKILLCGGSTRWFDDSCLVGQKLKSKGTMQFTTDPERKHNARGPQILGIFRDFRFPINTHMPQGTGIFTVHEWLYGYFKCSSPTKHSEHRQPTFFSGKVYRFFKIPPLSKSWNFIHQPFFRYTGIPNNNQLIVNSPFFVWNIYRFFESFPGDLALSPSSKDVRQTLPEFTTYGAPINQTWYSGPSGWVYLDVPVGNAGKMVWITWMSQEVSKWLVSGL